MITFAYFILSATRRKTKKMRNTLKRQTRHPLNSAGCLYMYISINQKATKTVKQTQAVELAKPLMQRKHCVENNVLINDLGDGVCACACVCVCVVD